MVVKNFKSLYLFVVHAGTILQKCKDPLSPIFLIITLIFLLSIIAIIPQYFTNLLCLSFFLCLLTTKLPIVSSNSWYVVDISINFFAKGNNLNLKTWDDLSLSVLTVLNIIWLKPSEGNVIFSSKIGENTELILL